MKQPEEERPPAPPPLGPGEPDDADDELEDDEEFETGEEVANDCRCGECCRHLIIEVGLADADREPKIRERGSPIYLPAELTASGEKELQGYVLNAKDNGYACAFLDQATNLCSIHDTRPWTCRVFDCEGEGREQLIQLGIRGKDGRTR
jgi:Fe-S-cluster containining protein